MCITCEQVEEILDNFDDSFDRTLKLIEKSIGAGTNPEHFKELLDRILNTEMAETENVDLEQNG